MDPLPQRIPSPYIWTSISMELTTIRWCRVRSYPACRTHPLRVLMGCPRIFSSSDRGLPSMRNRQRDQGLTFQQIAFHRLVFHFISSTQSDTLVEFNSCVDGDANDSVASVDRLSFTSCPAKAVSFFEGRMSSVLRKRVSSIFFQGITFSIIVAP